MRLAACAFAIGALFTVPHYPPAQEWKGEYGYQFAGALSDSVPFSMNLRMEEDRSGRFHGTIEEAQTFGDETRRHRLVALVEGRFYRDQILFLKTYSGEGEVRHGIAYAGYMNLDATRVDTGGWIMQDNWHGWFRMRRVRTSDK